MIHEKKIIVTALLLALGVFYLTYSSFTPQPSSDTTSYGELNKNYKIQQNNYNASSKNQSTASETYVGTSVKNRSSEIFNLNSTFEEEKLCIDDECSDYNFTLTNQQFCGDSQCSNSEKTRGNCCSDCDCSTGKVCNVEKLTCQTAVSPLSEQNALSIVNNFKEINPAYANYSLNYTYDSTMRNESVKVIVLQCTPDPGFACQYFLVINKEGKIVSEYSTN